MSEAPFEMANLFPKHTGLPFVVWILCGGTGRDVCVRVSADAQADRDMTTVAISPKVRIIAGHLDPQSFRLLRRWIEWNRETLVSYWEGEIDTQDALEALKP